MKCFVTGGSGTLGQELVRLCEQAGWQVVAPSHRHLDITDSASVCRQISMFGPEIVFHLAAYTDVDGCERSPDVAEQINWGGTANIVRGCVAVHAALLYVSTDHVFDGTEDGGYTEAAPPSPCNVYGATKLAGELAVRSVLSRFWIVRTAWLFGLARWSFIDRILEQADQGRPFSVVDDQQGSPTFARDLAKTIVQVVKAAPYGLYHVTNRGGCSRYDFARETARAAGKDSSLIYPALTVKGAHIAPRPRSTVLLSEQLLKAGLGLLPPWEDAVRRHVSERVRVP